MRGRCYPGCKQVPFCTEIVSKSLRIRVEALIRLNRRPYHNDDVQVLGRIHSSPPDRTRSRKAHTRRERKRNARKRKATESYNIQGS